MKVENFQLEEWVSGKTSADLNEIHSYKLYMNGKLISANLPYIEIEDGRFLQIDVCTECFTPGCSSGGYVEILRKGNLIIWKEPLITEDDDYFQSKYVASYAFKNGSVFWPLRLHQDFLLSFSEVPEENVLPKEGLSNEQAYDLWRLNASYSICSKAYQTLQLDTIESNIIAVDSDGLIDEQCHGIYQNSKSLLKQQEDLELVEIPEQSKKITFYFDVKDFDEWICVFVLEGGVILPIGDNFGLQLKSMD